MLEARWRSIHFSRAWYFGGPSYIFRAPSSYNLDRNLHVDPTKTKKNSHSKKSEEWDVWITAEENFTLNAHVAHTKDSEGQSGK